LDRNSARLAPAPSIGGHQARAEQINSANAKSRAADLAVRANKEILTVCLNIMWHFHLQVKTDAM